MSEKTDKKSKPLRSTSNKIKDIYNTYVKQDEAVGYERQADKEEKIETQVEETLKREKDSDNQIEIEDANENVEINEDLKINFHAEMEKLEFHIDDLEKERDGLKDQLLRRSAEMENLRRRTQKEKHELMEFGNRKLLMKFLEIPDDMNNALRTAQNGNNFESLLSGVEMINSKVNKLFSEEGVKLMDNLVGREFDVNYHEAVLKNPSDNYPEDHITQVIQEGYLQGDKVLRHAKVILSSGKG